ncbi:Predicted GTP-binding protein (ODN superfamily) [Phaffia rhodozyma]|uniref:Predicted GTP-binding protein (ODN superfamily) n=1 Tax=Phaffia rhodozyma TaxID=264483 RepID=A0A0F7SX44_PHARH|nr:Predicted GTP-binding protein (ODN superfamily) [Phaffia rhodozyma]
MVRLSLARLGRIRSPPAAPPPPGYYDTPVPFRPLPQASTSVPAFSSSSPLSSSESASPAEPPPNTSFDESDINLPAPLPSRWDVLAKRRVNQKFLDYVHIVIRGGRGGDGCIAFTKLPHRRDLRGPPSGGSGGEGGPVYIQACDTIGSLSDVKRRIVGLQGSTGAGDYQNGKKGGATIIKVPPGTMIRQISRTVYRPLTPEEELLPPADRDPLMMRALLICHPTARASEDNPPPITPAHVYGTTIHGTPLPPPPPIELDLSAAINEPILLVRGGKGGEGNTIFGLHDKKGKHLWARKGEVPDEVKLELELRLLADIGFLGAPNVGKSTLLQALTAASPRIASYQFTTLNPLVGLCRILDDGTVVSSPTRPKSLEVPESSISFDEPVLPTERFSLDVPLPVGKSNRARAGPRHRTPSKDESLRFRICDNPGLIKDSHLNKGLGHQFLLSVSRSPILALVLDFSLSTEKLLEQAEMVVHEVEMFEPESRLKERIRLVVGNKADEVSSPAIGRKRLRALQAWVKKRLGTTKVWDEYAEQEVEIEANEDVQIKLISGKWGQGIRELAFRMGELVVAKRHEDFLAREERKRAEKEAEEDAVRELQKPILRIGDVPEKKPEIGFGLREEEKARKMDDSHIG